MSGFSLLQTIPRADIDVGHEWTDQGFPEGTKVGDAFLRTKAPNGLKIHPTEEVAISVEEARTLGLFAAGPGVPDGARPKSVRV